MINNVLNYFSELSERLCVTNMLAFDKLGLFTPLTFRIEKQENS